MRHPFVARVVPTDDDRFLGEVVDTRTGQPAGLSSVTRSADESAGDAIYFAEALNEHAQR